MSHEAREWKARRRHKTRSKHKRSVNSLQKHAGVYSCNYCTSIQCTQQHWRGAELLMANWVRAEHNRHGSHCMLRAGVALRCGSNIWSSERQPFQHLGDCRKVFEDDFHFIDQAFWYMGRCLFIKKSCLVLSSDFTVYGQRFTIYIQLTNILVCHIVWQQKVWKQTVYNIF